MKLTEYKISKQNFIIPIWEYETAEETDKAAGRVGACNDESNKNLRYRGSFQDARNIVWETLEKVTKVEPLTKDTGKKAEDGTPITEYIEKEEQYFARALADSGMTVEQVQPAITEACNAFNKGKGIANDISERERKAPQPKKLAARWSDAAKTLIANPDKLQTFNNRAADLLGKDFESTGDADKDIIALGTLVKEFVEKKEADALAQAIS